MMKRRSYPSLPTLRRICDGLGITLQQFFAEDNTPSSLTPQQEECLALFRVLAKEEQALAIAYMKGLARKL